MSTSSFEERHKNKAIITSVVAALLILADIFISPALTTSKTPINNSPALILSFHEHSTGVIISTLEQVIALLAATFSLTYLFKAVKARKPEFSILALICTVGGGITTAVLFLASKLVLISKAGDYAQTAKTYEQAKAVLHANSFVITTDISRSGAILFGLGLVMISLNALRVGLLTRPVGIIGVLAGGINVLVSLMVPTAVNPLSMLLLVFWLGWLAFTLHGRKPEKVPPAWTSGKAEPWPSMKDLQKQRQQEAA